MAAAVLVLSACEASHERPRDAPPAARLTRQVARVSEGEERFNVNYWQYLPPRSREGRPPVLVFLHGLGERAVSDDPVELSLVLLHGPPMLVKRGDDLCFRVAGRRSCFLLLAPQALPSMTGSAVRSCRSSTR